MKVGLYSVVVETETAEEVETHLQDVPKDSAIFFDVDDTIITPVSRNFNSSIIGSIIDGIKKINHAETVSNWLLQRKVMLVDLEWPEVIDRLKQYRSVYALSKIDSGEFGNITSMAEWQFHELLSLGIDFSQNSALPRHKIDTANSPEFYKGIFITGSYSKSQTLQIYKEHIPMKFVVMVDDKMEHIKDVKKFCKTNKISFLGIHFSGVGRLGNIPDPEIAPPRKWLDGEAQLAMISADDSQQS